MDVTNQQIADQIRTMGQLLEIQGGDSFKIRAYYRAAETIKRLDQPAMELSEEALVSVPHIGKNIAKKIIEYVETGQISELEKLKSETPPGLADMLRINGVGPKTVHTLWRKLGIESVEELESAARQRRIRSLRGFGERKEKEILQSIAELRRQRGRMTRIEADEIIGLLESVCTEGTYVVAGSYRRGLSTIGDIDIVTREPPSRLNPLLRKVADDVIGEGERKTSIHLLDRRVDVRFTNPDVFGSMLMYFTGSKNFNIRMRTFAMEKAWKVNEYGILDQHSGETFKFATEEEMFSFLGMEYIPPELREDEGEIELALHHKLPSLVDDHAIKGDLHVHSNWSDGTLSLRELVEVGTQRGYSYVLCTDHSSSLGVAGGLDEERLAQQRQEIERVNRDADCQIIAGIEVDILADGTLGLPNRILADLEIVIASVHSGFRQEKDTLTRRIITAIENDHVDIIGHPTGRLIGRRPPYAVDIDRVISAAADTGTALEINASPFRLDLDDIYVRQAKENGVKLAIGTDAHRAAEFEHMHLGVMIARRGWCEPADILNSLSLPELMEWAV